MADSSFSFNTMIHMVTIKLSSTNYLLWRNQLLPLLQCQNLLSHVDGSVAAPPTTIASDSSSSQPNPKYVEWQLQDQRLLSLLFSSLTEEAMAEVLGLTTARDVWLALENSFSHISKTRELRIKDDLQLIKRGTRSVTEYSRSFKALCDQLTAMGCLVDDTDKVHWYLRGLGADFANFSTAQMSLTPLPAFKDLVPKAESFEIFQKSLGSSSPISSVAFTVTNGSLPTSRGGSFSKSRRSRGGHNGGHGHGRGKRGSYTPRCQICKTEGHTADRCRNRYDRAEPTAQLAEAFTTACSLSNGSESDWFTDTGASAHMTPDPSQLDKVEPYHGKDCVIVGNGASLPITHTGTLSPSSNFQLLDVLVVPRLTKNLLSISKLTSDFPLSVTFSHDHFVVQNRVTGTAVAKGKREGGLYVLERGNSAFVSVLRNKNLHASFELWHARLGHVNHSILSLLNKKGQLFLTSLLPNPSLCSTCQLAKSHRLPYSPNTTRSHVILGLIHCDIWGPAPVKSNLGFSYYVLFIDDYSRFTWLYPMKLKSDFFDIFLQFQKLVENQYSTKIKIFQSDGGAEFTSNRFQSHLRQFGIHHQMSCPYTPSQNGRAERKHRHVTETGLALLFHSHVPPRHWVDAFSTATYIINRLPMPVLGGLSPFEVLFGKPPNYENFHPFGCRVYPCLRDYAPHKFSPRSLPCIFLGYSSSHKGFRCFDTITSRTYITRHARFDENFFPFSHNSSAATLANIDFSHFFEPCALEPSPSTSSPTTTQVPPSPCHFCADDSAVEPLQVTSTESTSPSAAISPAPAPSTDLAPPAAPMDPIHATTSSAPSAPHPMTTRSKSGIFKPRHPAHLSLVQSSPLIHALLATSEPKGFKSAAKNPAWLAAMDEEMKALHTNDTWDLVPRPSNTNIVGSKWVFRTKFLSDGSIERFKARLVAKGYTQLPGLDYTDTFSPVVKASTVRVVLSLAVSHKWPIRQLDVKNAFLNGILHETVYMEQPPGYVDPCHPLHVCKLKKALYGLKQAPRAWFQRFSSFLLKLGFFCSRADTSLFVFNRQDDLIYLLLYVDDIILTGNTSALINRFISQLHSEFAVKDLGPLNYFLGLEASPTPDGLFLSQVKYATDVLARAQLLDSKPVTTPMIVSQRLSSEGTPFADPTLYRSLVGALQYLTITRPDLAHSVNSVSQFLHAPTDVHFQVVKRILRYVKGTLNFGLQFTSSSSMGLVAYSDADWAGCPDTRRSTSGYSIFLGKNLVSWSAKKQPTVSRSSCESEYRALALAATEVLWLTHLLQDLRVPLTHRPLLLCDNKSAIFLSSNPVSHKRAKHIELDYHFLRELVVAGTLRLQHVPSHLQLADVFTKSVSRDLYVFFRSKLRVCVNPTLSLRGAVENPSKSILDLRDPP